MVRDAKYTEPNAPARPMFFLPLAQQIDYANDLLAKLQTRSSFVHGILLKTGRSIASLEPEVRKLCSDVDPNITVIDVNSMQEQVAMNFNQQRAVASLAGLFGAVALLLAAVGLYGVTAYGVARRTNEIGVRMALGADRLGVIRLVLKGAFKQVSLGLLLGIPLAIGAGRLMGNQLYGLTSTDPAALFIAILSLTMAALIAALIPARRAATIDPMKPCGWNSRCIGDSVMTNYPRYSYGYRPRTISAGTNRIDDLTYPSANGDLGRRVGHFRSGDKNSAGSDVGRTG